MDRHQQQRRISRIRQRIIGGSAVGALALAGYLGAGAATADETPATTTSSDTAGTSSGTSTDSGSTWPGMDGSSLSSGSGSAHARTAGS